MRIVRYAADSDFVDVPVAGLLDRHYLAARLILNAMQSLGIAQPGEPRHTPAIQFGDDCALGCPAPVISVSSMPGGAPWP